VPQIVIAPRGDNSMNGKRKNGFVFLILDFFLLLFFFSKIKMLKNRTKYRPSKIHYDKKIYNISFAPMGTCVPPKEKRKSILFANI
jgi:hypothetical protein